MILRSSLAYVKEETFAQTQSIGFAPSWRRLGPKSALSVGRRYSQPLRDEYRPPSPQRRRRVRRPPVPSAMSPGAVRKFQFSCVLSCRPCRTAWGIEHGCAVSSPGPRVRTSPLSASCRGYSARDSPLGVSSKLDAGLPRPAFSLGRFTWQANQSRNPASPSRGAEMRLDVIRLHAVGLTYSEIAGQLGISRNTVASAVFKYKNPDYVRKYDRERKRKVKPVQAKRPEKAAKPKLPKRPRGRPIGTGIDDSAHIEKLKTLSSKTGLKLTPLIRSIGFTDPSHIRRIRDKFKSITAPLG